MLQWCSAAVFGLFTVGFTFATVHGVLVGQKSTEAIPLAFNEGDAFIIECRTSLSMAVDWEFQAQHDGRTVRVCSDGVITNDRFGLETDRTSFYNLVVANATVSDSGLYSCIENAGIGSRQSFNVSIKTVLEGNTMTTTESRGNENFITETATDGSPPTTRLDKLLIIVAPVLGGIALISLVVLIVVGKKHHWCDCFRRTQHGGSQGKPTSSDVLLGPIRSFSATYTPARTGPAVNLSIQ